MELKKPSTITDALAYLTEKTGRLWTDSDLLQIAMNCYPPLQAYPDKASPVEEKLYEHLAMATVEVCTKEIPWEMAILDSDEIEQLIQSATTYAKHAFGHDAKIWAKISEDAEESEYQQTREFKTAVCVTTNMVRVPAELIEKIIFHPEAWPTTSAPDAKKSETGLKKLEKQIQAIENLADEFGYPQQAIPNGGKAALKMRCKENFELFGAGDDPFLDAWKKAVKQKRIKMADHDKFSHK